MNSKPGQEKIGFVSKPKEENHIKNQIKQDSNKILFDGNQIEIEWKISNLEKLGHENLNNKIWNETIMTLMCCWGV